MWNIDFKTYRNGELIEYGFETSYAQDLSHALQEADTILDLQDCDKVVIQINKIEFKTK